MSFLKDLQNELKTKQIFFYSSYIFYFVDVVKNINTSIIHLCVNVLYNMLDALKSGGPNILYVDR